MEQFYPVAIVTLLACALLFAMTANVARAHRKSGIPAPAMTGHPLLERAVRVHYNTLEGMPIFLPSLWLFAIYWSPTIAALLGLVWLAGRVIYFITYMADPSKRTAGFLIQTAASMALMLGALGRVLYLWVV